MAGTSFDADDIVGHIESFIGDTSRSREDTREGLEKMQELIETQLEAMDEEDAKAERESREEDDPDEDDD